MCLCLWHTSGWASWVALSIITWLDQIPVRRVEIQTSETHWLLVQWSVRDMMSCKLHALRVLQTYIQVGKEGCTKHYNHVRLDHVLRNTEPTSETHWPLSQWSVRYVGNQNEDAFCDSPTSGVTRRATLDVGLTMLLDLLAEYSTIHTSETQLPLSQWPARNDEYET